MEPPPGCPHHCPVNTVPSVEALQPNDHLPGEHRPGIRQGTREGTAAPEALPTQKIPQASICKLGVYCPHGCGENKTSSLTTQSGQVLCVTGVAHPTPTTPRARVGVQEEGLGRRVPGSFLVLGLEPTSCLPQHGLQIRGDTCLIKWPTQCGGWRGTGQSFWVNGHTGERVQ